MLCEEFVRGLTHYIFRADQKASAECRKADGMYGVRISQHAPLCLKMESRSVSRRAVTMVISSQQASLGEASDRTKDMRVECGIRTWKIGGRRTGLVSREFHLGRQEDRVWMLVCVLQNTSRRLQIAISDVTYVDEHFIDKQNEKVSSR